MKKFVDVVVLFILCMCISIHPNTPIVPNHFRFVSLCITLPTLFLHDIPSYLWYARLAEVFVLFDYIWPDQLEIWLICYFFCECFVVTERLPRFGNGKRSSYWVIATLLYGCFMSYNRWDNIYQGVFLHFPFFVLEWLHGIYFILERASAESIQVSLICTRAIELITVTDWFCLIGSHSIDKTSLLRMILYRTVLLTLPVVRDEFENE